MLNTTMVTGGGTNMIDHNHEMLVMLEYYLVREKYIKH